MSADNGIYLLESLDGWRAIHAQCIENIYWWENWSCCGNPVPCKNGEEDFCQHCGSYLPKYERRNEINPNELKAYFEKSEIYKTHEEGMFKAVEIYENLGYTEYGICQIRGWEDKPFPK